MSLQKTAVSQQKPQKVADYLKSNEKTYREIRLKGKSTKNVKYLVIIDDDEEGQKLQIEQNKKRKKISDQKIIQQQITKRMGITRKESQKTNQQKKSLAKIQVNSRIQTRRSKPKNQFYYQRKNYANIPYLLDHQQATFKQMIIKKCVSLRSRQYVILDDPSPNK